MNGAPSIAASISLPATQIRHPWQTSRRGPNKVTSKPGSNGSLHSAAFARAKDGKSIAPPEGTPLLPSPNRGSPCTEVNNPGDSTRKTGGDAESDAEETNDDSRRRWCSLSPISSNVTRSPGISSEGGERRGSNSRTGGFPISLQPPGVSEG